MNLFKCRSECKPEFWLNDVRQRKNAWRLGMDIACDGFVSVERTRLACWFQRSAGNLKPSGAAALRKSHAVRAARRVTREAWATKKGSVVNS